MGLNQKSIANNKVSKRKLFVEILINAYISCKTTSEGKDFSQ
jgi:hypothetical protein